MSRVIILLFIVACTDPYQDCIEREKESYRASHPRASYGEIQHRTKDFEMMCSSFRTKG